MKLAIRERDTQRACLEYLQVLENQGKCWFIRNNSVAGKLERGGYIRNNKPGAPDTIVLVAARFLAVEFKSSKGKLSPAQAAVKRQIERLGGSYYEIRDVEELHRIIRQYRKAA